MNTENPFSIPPTLCPIPGRYLGMAWADIPTDALEFACRAYMNHQNGQPAPIDAGVISEECAAALLDELRKRRGLPPEDWNAPAPAAPPAAQDAPQEPPAAAPMSPAPTTAPEPPPAPSTPSTPAAGAHLYCPIPGKHLGHLWTDLPDAALDDALVNVKPWKGYAEPLGDRFVSAILDAMEAHGHPIPMGGQTVPPYDWGKRRPGRPRTRQAKPILSDSEKAERRIAIAKKAAAASAAARAATAAYRKYQAINLDVDVLEHLRSTSTLLGKPYSIVVDMALDNLDAVTYMTPECVRIFENICAKTREEPDKLLRRILTEFESRLE